jgi:hypothetical protein
MKNTKIRVLSVVLCIVSTVSAVVLTKKGGTDARTPSKIKEEIGYYLRDIMGNSIALVSQITALQEQVLIVSDDLLRNNEPFATSTSQKLACYRDSCKDMENALEDFRKKISDFEKKLCYSTSSSLPVL